MSASSVSASIRPATVALVGRPNVGKSSLFNRLIGQRLAIVDESPGVTRDRLYALTEWRGRIFTLVDTAGIDTDSPSDSIEAKTRAQAEAAASEADVIVFVVDAAEGLNPLDDDVVAIMRRTRRPVVLVANKAESNSARDAIHGEFARLGLGEPFAVSAIHGEGTGDLLDAIVERLPPQSEQIEQPQNELGIAIIGQPNVGKSSLLNALLGTERALVSDVPGTTRDALDSIFPYRDRTIRLIDTAGVRKKPTAHGSIEYYASLRSLARDCTRRHRTARSRFDARSPRAGSPARRHRDRGAQRPDHRFEQVGSRARTRRVFASRAERSDLSTDSVRALCAGRVPLGVDAPSPRRDDAGHHGRCGKSRTPRPNRSPQRNHPGRRARTSSADDGHKDLKIYYGSQVATRPPLFIFNCNDPELVRPSYQRFLENVLRSLGRLERRPAHVRIPPATPDRTDEGSRRNRASPFLLGLASVRLDRRARVSSKPTSARKAAAISARRTQRARSEKVQAPWFWCSMRLEGFVPTILAQYVGGLPLALLAGFAAIVGHCYSPFMRFRGGKGVATELGVLFGLAWQAALIFIGVWILAVVATGFASVASLLASLSTIGDTLVVARRTCFDLCRLCRRYHRVAPSREHRAVARRA